MSLPYASVTYLYFNHHCHGMGVNHSFSMTKKEGHTGIINVLRSSTKHNTSDRNMYMHCVFSVNATAYDSIEW